MLTTNKILTESIQKIFNAKMQRSKDASPLHGAHQTGLGPRNRTTVPSDSTQRAQRISQRPQSNLRSAFLCANLCVLCGGKSCQNGTRAGDSTARKANKTTGNQCDTTWFDGVACVTSQVSASLLCPESFRGLLLAIYRSCVETPRHVRHD